MLIKKNLLKKSKGAKIVDLTEHGLGVALIEKSANFAQNIGLKVNAGHGLHYHNVQAIAKIPQIIELNIGHAIVAKAVFSGMEKAVRDMRQLIVEARS